MKQRSTFFHAHTLAAYGCLLTLAATPLRAAAADLPVNQYLDMDLKQLLEVTITSVMKKAQPLNDTPAAVFVITQDDIRRSGVTTIADALAMAPGIHVAQISGSKWAITARGFGGTTSNKLLVMIDGRTVYAPSYNSTYWDAQNLMLEDVERVEVVRGPGGTIWGANAVNGVINIITKKAQDTQGTLLRAGVGNEEKLTGAVRHGGQIGENAFARLSVNGTSRDSNVLAANGRDANDGWQDVRTGIRADGTVGSKNEWSIQGDFFNISGDDIVTPYWSIRPPYLFTHYGDYMATGGSVNARWQHTLSGGDRLTIKGYYDNNHREESYYEQTFITHDLEMEYETTLADRHSLVAGIGYRQIDADYRDTFQVHVPAQVNDLYSAFLQDEILLIRDRLWLTLGTKWEHNDFTGNEWQPSGRLLWKPADHHVLWTAVSRAVRTPSMTEAGGDHTIAVRPIPTGGIRTIRLQGNPDVGPELLMAYEAGHRWQIQTNLSLDTALYFNDYDDIYAFRSTGGATPTLRFANGLQGEGYGAEVALNWRPKTWLTMAAAYTWQELDLEAKDPGVNLSSQITTYQMNNPKHSLSLRTSLDLNDQWQVNGWLRHAMDVFDGYNGSLASVIPGHSYTLVDANLIWKPRKELEIMFAVQNLFNSGQLEYLTEHITPPTEIERGVYGKVTWRF